DLETAKGHAVSVGHLPFGPFRLAEVVFVVIDADDLGTSRCELECVESRVAADVERPHPSHVLRETRRELIPLATWEVAQRMIRRGLPPSGQVKVVEPR